MKHSALKAILLTSITLLGPAFAQDAPDSVLRGNKQFRKNVLVAGLEGPWEVTWGPDSMLWVTERTGKRVTRIDPASGARSVAITINEVSAPGGQDGLLGMALHPDLLKGSGNDYVYVAYTYVDQGKGADPTITDPQSPYRFLYMKVARLTYNQATKSLANPVDLVTGLPAGNDHVSGRLKVGPDRKLYLTIGDQGNNQLGNYCLPVEAQRLPTREEINSKNYIAYVGKSLRLNLDGSVPTDNPNLAGVVSHVFTYGHRNIQGIDFGPDGTLYASEHGPKTDDEVNILKSGSNYGWPHVAGKKDNNAYQYARWAEASSPCAQLGFSDLAIHPSVPREPESAFTKPFVEPIATMFTVPSDYNFHDPACKGIDYICWPTVGASSIEYYPAKSAGIPGWDRVLLVTTLKRGSLYVLPLNADRQSPSGKFSRYFQSENRFRDVAVNPDGKKIYIATDPSGLAQALAGGTTRTMQDRGAILAFTYEGEGGATSSDESRPVSAAGQPNRGLAPISAGASAPAASPAAVPAQFSTAQVAAGKTAYNSNCAVCHGNTLTNGTFGTPLGGDYFKNAWFGKTVRAFYEYAQKMPPAAPGSLPADTYASIVAYIFEMNGLKPGAAQLPAGGAALDKMAIK